MTDERCVVGLDGYPAGWLGCVWRGPGHAPGVITLPSLGRAAENLPPNVSVIAIDIPLGLDEAAVPGGRECDRLARQRIGPRASSVFSSPARGALRATTHLEASALNRQSGPLAPGLSLQAFAIFPKLLDADTALAGSSWLRERVIEVHPEVSFRELAGVPLSHGKKCSAGKAERRALLATAGFDGLVDFEGQVRRAGAATDDGLDACVAAWTAWRHLRGEAGFLPPHASGPTHALRIWY